MTRRRRAAQILCYGGESHSLAQSPANIRDVYSLILEWFDTYLTL
jgi:dipeptidyl aminopeptidase/acylaminoacyl peptidase